jgi:hypothetical protein
MYAFAAFLHRRIWQSYHHGLGQPGAVVDFYFYNDPIQAYDRTGIDPG